MYASANLEKEEDGEDKAVIENNQPNSKFRRTIAINSINPLYAPIANLKTRKPHVDVDVHM